MSEIQEQNINTESQIIEGLIRRDEHIFEYVYDNYAAALLGAIMRIIKNKELAEEVLQDSFINIWQKIDTYSDAKGKLYTWMYNIARNKALDKIRSKEYSQMSATIAVEMSHNPEYSSEETNQGDLFAEDLLKYLKPEQAEIIQLMYFQGYTSEDVSKMRNIPIGTVKSRVRAALKRLRKVHGLPAWVISVNLLKELLS